jgi:HK97 gp10 family phage protein
LTAPQAKSAIRKASREALKPVVAEAKANAPVRSGALRRSIRLRSITRSRSRIGARVTTSAKDNAFKGRTYYGGFLEYGWKAGKRVRNEDMGVGKFKRRTEAQVKEAATREGRRRQVPAREFMKRAAQSKKGQALQIYRDETQRWILKLSEAKG